VSVRETHTRRQIREGYRGFQHNAPDRRNPIGLAEKAAAQDDINSVSPKNLDHVDQVGDLMLAIRVEGRDDGCPLRQRELEARLKRRALAQVYRMADDVRSSLPRLAGRSVSRPVVNDCYIMETHTQFRDRLANDLGFVEGRHYDPDVAELRLHVAHGSAYDSMLSRVTHSQ
jgi:hypothetical protein